MDRSVRGYFEKCSTEELTGMLSYCLNNYNSYQYVIMEMLEILEQRISLEELSPSVMKYLTLRLQENKQHNEK